MGLLSLICLIFYFIVIEIIYHKFFRVIYFDLTKGLLKEMLAVLVISMVLAALTAQYFFIIIIFIAIAIIIVKSKGSK